MVSFSGNCNGWKREHWQRTQRPAKHNLGDVQNHDSSGWRVLCRLRKNGGKREGRERREEEGRRTNGGATASAHRSSRASSMAAATFGVNYVFDPKIMFSFQLSP